MIILEGIKFRILNIMNITLKLFSSHRAVNCREKWRVNFGILNRRTVLSRSDLVPTLV